MTATIEHLNSGHKLRTSLTMGVHINSDTEMDCDKVVEPDGREYFVAHFRSPGDVVAGLSLFMSEEDMLRLWFVFETARRSDGSE